METKNKFTRDNLKGNFLKQIIFRIDYSGVVDILPIVKDFMRKYGERVGIYSKTFHNKVDLDMRSLEDISETLSVPVRVLEKEVVHRFTDSKNEASETIFDISTYYTSFTINCKRYNSITDYKNLFNDYIAFMFSSNNSFEIKRIGLRKISEKVVQDYTELFKIFEQNMFCNSDDINSNFDSNNINNLSVISPKKSDEIINYNRRILKGFITKKDGKREVAYQAVLDMDCFLKDEFLNSVNEQKKASDTISRMNSILFDIYKMSVTYEYLETLKVK
ncbi:TIGR04255 family protein [Marinilabiliaceae bacterium JC040]|nr:TIGR04255 family protein [Marinilabiliaceae bacterium JC040]